MTEPGHDHKPSDLGVHILKPSTVSGLQPDTVHYDCMTWTSSFMSLSYRSVPGLSVCLCVWLLSVWLPVPTTPGTESFVGQQYVRKSWYLERLCPCRENWSPFLVNWQEERHRAVEIHWWSLFPLISMSWDRKDGNETESGNQRPTLPAFWYKPRRSLKILDSDNLVGGYDCIFVNAGD